MNKKSGKAAKWTARRERLSAALRENLKRRKAQARRRAAAADVGAAPQDETGSAGAQSSGKIPDFRRNRGNE